MDLFHKPSRALLESGTPIRVRSLVQKAVTQV